MRCIITLPYKQPLCDPRSTFHANPLLVSLLVSAALKLMSGDTCSITKESVKYLSQPRLELGLLIVHIS